ncbi:MAG: hypothetical protein HKP12_04545 [Gammaproteobacteria bacterium]|nr:hypothetical protein [Gammaproteobacteria bacterium]NNJ96408.1 hypothetical protein [Gammaproteobacteria bacterium]
MRYQIRSILLAICFFLATDASAISFTADAIQMRGESPGQARMFWKDGSVRFEYLDQGVPMVQIFDNKNRKVIWLDTKNKVYMQRELTEEQAAPVDINTSEKYNPCTNFTEAECNFLKSTQYNGRAADKWLLTFNVDDKDHHVFQWIDQQHRILIRQENPDGSVLDVKILDDQEVNGRQVRKVDMIAISPDGSSVHGIQWYDEELNIVVRQQVDDGSIDELRNIKVEDVSSNLFAIPEGYKSVESQLTDSNSNLP